MNEIFKAFAGISALIIVAVLAFSAVNNAEAVSAAALFQRPASTPMATATETLTPTATIDYVATAQIAEATSNAALATSESIRQAMIGATMTHEYNAQMNLQATMIADQYTATAAAAYVPLTSTAQVDLNNAIATQQNILATQMVMTQIAPTALVAMSRATTQAKYADVQLIMQLFMMGSAGVMFLMWGLGMMKRLAHQPAPVAQPQPKQMPQPQEMRLTVKRENSPINTSWQMSIIPCSPHMLAELADGLINGGKTLAVNQWEGHDTIWNRAAFLKMRNFLQVNQFASSTGGGSLTLTPLGQAFLREYLTSRTLPRSIEWSETLAPKVTSMAHAHEAHAHEREAGEGLEDYEPLPA